MTCTGSAAARPVKCDAPGLGEGDLADRLHVASRFCAFKEPMAFAALCYVFQNVWHTSIVRGW